MKLTTTSQGANRTVPPPSAVMTVCGSVGADDLGMLLPHEHLLADFTPPTGSAAAAELRQQLTSADAKALYDSPLTMRLLGPVSLGAPNRDDSILDSQQTATAEVAAYRDAGGMTITDLTSGGLGRQPAALRAISRATNVNIVMGSGWYHPSWAPEIAGRPAGELADEIVRELTDGIDGVRAGVVGEIAALSPTDPDHCALLAAAGQASRRTGAAVVLDCAADLEQTRRALDVLADNGADLARVAVAHCGFLSTDLDEAASLLDRGVYIMFDQLGRLPSVLSTWDDGDVATAVTDLAAGGYADKILLSNSLCAKHHLLAYGGGGYAFVAQQFLPYMSMMFGAEPDLGVLLTKTNPQRLLAREMSHDDLAAAQGERS